MADGSPSPSVPQLHRPVRVVQERLPRAVLLVAEAKGDGRVPAGAEGRADELHVRLAGRATALAAIRRTVTIGGGMTFDDGMRLELEAAASLADTADFAEGIDAFLEKRPQDYKKFPWHY